MDDLPARIVFSRKGFDSQYGRVPSPVLEDGTIVPFPIPSRFGRPLGELQSPCGPMHELVQDLTGGAIDARTSVHLDPDLVPDCVPRQAGWRASLGQVGAALGHLSRQGVGPGDLFLFFGWFRPAQRHRGRWRYVPDAPSVHALFGWLRVDEVLDVHDSAALAQRPWLADHPHVIHAQSMGSPNRIFLSRERCSGPAYAGGGLFRRWSPALQLTAPGCSRSIWRLPAWMQPSAGFTQLTYHTAPTRWAPQGEHVLLQTVGKGQEFVLQTQSRVDLRHWLGSVFQDIERSD